MNTEDRRVRKTEKALQNALAELMLHKDLHHITVQELADLADVHRVTFYSHYHDVYDLYEQIENRILGELENLVRKDPSHLYAGVYETVVDYMYENQRLFYMLLCSENDNAFKSKACSLLERKYIDIWMYEDNLSAISDEMRFLTSYYVNGCVAILTMWAKGNYALGKEEVVRMLAKVDLNFEGMAGSE
ncbi:MAG: TetR family transcriptional regulator C-terminal domain-containing protein [Oscillospiraceae bacterium]|nr:TetR family transcriptional regulator C-terminal domain-containing protein [Oscillospiraceae bacterium]